MKKRLWERQLYDSIQCFWCDAVVAQHHKTIEHLLPKRHGGKDAQKNCVMACTSCNNDRGSLDDAFVYFVDDTYDLQRYLNRQRNIAREMGSYHFNKLCCPQKNKTLIDFYQEAYSNKFHYHPFQENL